VSPTTRRAGVVAAACVLAVACAPLTRVVGPAPARAWPGALARAQRSAARGEFDAADSTLADYATRYPTSDDALEASYWRALFALDPSNRKQSVSGAIASLDSYLADTRHREHVLEATMLRRVAGELDALTRLAASAIAQVKDANTAAAIARALADARIEPAKAAAESTSATDAEIKRLKDELAKANAELDRIRRRLAQPPPAGT
jgi:hypothetical protein